MNPLTWSAILRNLSERVNKIKICIEEAGRIFQLRIVTDVFIQNGERRPLDQLPAETRLVVKIRNFVLPKKTASVKLGLKNNTGGSLTDKDG